jgi:spermidine/putrescine-binding protein
MKSVKTMIASFVLLTFAVINAQDQAEMMKKWQDYMTPGPVHKAFEKNCGTWKADITQYMGGQEMKAEGKAVFEMILGGRYMKSSFNSTIMGMPMEGFGLDAFDNITKEYISVWLDNMGTGVMQMKGKFDPETKAVTYWGSMIDPMTGKEAKVKTVLIQSEDNKMTFDMFTVDGGQETKNMTIVYTRTK